MRICYIVEAAGGGSGQVVIDLLKMGVETGDDITLIYSPDRALPDFMAELNAIKSSITCYNIPMRRSIGMHDIRSTIQLYKLLRKIEHFDIINSHSSKAGALARIAGLFIPKSVHVYTPHAFMTMAPSASPVYGWIEWLLSWLCSGIICVSQKEKEHAIDVLKISKKKLFVVPNGIYLNYPATRESARARTDFSGDDFVVGYVGRFVPQKNPLRLIKAFAIAANKHPQLRLAIIGNGELHNGMLRLIEHEKLTARIQFLGRQNGRDFMPGFDCLVGSSDYEGFAITALEAMDAGTPVISTPVGGTIEAIQQGKTGWVTSSFEPEELAKYINICVNRSDAERSQMSAMIKNQSLNFSVKIMANKTRDVFKTILKA